MEKNIHILLIGPVTNVAAKLIGGATISFGYLTSYLDRTGEEYTLVNTKKYGNGWTGLFNPLYTLLKILGNAHRADVLFLNSSRGGTKYLAPLVFVIAKMFKAKFVFRPFGGDLKDYTAHYNGLQKWIFNHTILKADIFFLQTKALMEFYDQHDAHILQLPTSRDHPPENLLRGNRPFQKRFVYLGAVNPAKGVDHILEAAKLLDADYTLHVYGPLADDKYRKKMESEKDVYQGVLQKEQVWATLRQYDVLMLPTFYEGEGYPGVLLEAYSLGLPVIATDWKAIPEIVKHGITGRLIVTQSTGALVEAIRFFDTANYPLYSKNALEYFNTSFSSEQITGKAIRQIKALFYSSQKIINTN